MSAATPCAASDFSMPTWIAPKLPPPANTKAVLTWLAASDADTVSSPRVMASTRRWAGYSNGSGRRASGQTLDVVPADAGIQNDKRAWVHRAVAPAHNNSILWVWAPA